MSPLDLPGAPLKPPPSKKSIKCPRCNTVHRGEAVVKALRERAIKDITFKCKNCGYLMKLKKKLKQ